MFDKIVVQPKRHTRIAATVVGVCGLLAVGNWTPALAQDLARDLFLEIAQPAATEDESARRDVMRAAAAASCLTMFR